MNWLQGGPYYELSFLVRNKRNKESLLKEILESLTNRVNVKIVDSFDQLTEKVDSFVKGYEEEGIIRRSIDINSEIQIEGNRKSRIFIEELSEELMKLNFWFYGSEYDAEEWNQIGIKENQKPKFRELFQLIKKELNPILGTIAYEEDCSELFDTDQMIPNVNYKLQNLNLQYIHNRMNLNPNEFEYCWISANQIGNKNEIEIKMKTG